MSCKINSIQLIITSNKNRPLLNMNFINHKLIINEMKIKIGQKNLIFQKEDRIVKF
jgi:hypothetical protein